MDYIYRYDKVTFEYIDKDYARKDPEKSKEAGKPVYLVPPYYTTKKPPTLGKYQVAIYQSDKWVVKDDYRGSYICDELLNVQVVQDIGELPDGSILITEQEAETIKNDPYWYIVLDGELVKNPNYDEDVEKARKERIAKLGMTKYDFYKYVCLPNEISYTMLMQMVMTNEEIAAAWNLCGHVFRDDETLCKYITDFLPSMTDEVLDAIFEQYGKEINE